MVSSEGRPEDLPCLDGDLQDRLTRGRHDRVGKRDHVVLHRDAGEAHGDRMDPQRFLRRDKPD